MDAKDEGEDPAMLRHRFICELEFVQCLSSPDFLHWLARERYLNDARFLLYLRYLEYWKKAEYIEYLIYPQCLNFLESCISSKPFREKLKDPAAITALKLQQACSWIYSDRRPCDFEPFLEHFN